ncbi:MAG: hypothetical protein WBP02_04620 [Gammaproteobacteria bacterium]
MIQITNDTEFRQALKGLDAHDQRLIAARFIEHVLPLSTDKRIAGAVSVAADNEASDDELLDALRSAKSATFDSHTRCGSEGNWTEQAGYFVSRAAVAALTPCEQCSSGSPAWQAAMSSRMARTCMEIDEENVSESGESAQQYSILSDYLNS